MALFFDFLSTRTELLLGVLFSVVIFSLISRLFENRRKRGNYPPGPVGLPFVGYLPFLTDKPHLKFEELRKKYGDIFSCYLGKQYTVILNDAESTRDAFTRDEFHGRPEKSVLAPGMFATNISSANGRDWQEQRKLVFHALRGAGKGNDFVESVVQEEIHRFLQTAKNKKGEQFDIKDDLSTSVSNILTALAFGKVYESDNKTRKFLNHCVQEIVTRSSQVAVQNFFPWIGTTPLINKYEGWDEYLRMLEKMKDYFQEEIREHEKTLDPKNVRDFIDASLVQEKKAKEDGTYTSCSNEMLLGSLYTMFGAGSETVRTSLQWLFLAMVTFPNVQKRIQKEIDEVIGSEREPNWSDQKNMPYTLSVIMEAQRLFTIVPINIIHYTMEDTKVRQYDIPKDTLVISNMWAIFRDPKEWKNPEEFVPERFLEADQKNIVRNKAYIPFSIGKRICPGEALAMIEMFLFLTSTLQKYDVLPPKGTTVSLKPEFYITTQPENQDLRFVERH